MLRVHCAARHTAGWWHGELRHEGHWTAPPNKESFSQARCFVAETKVGACRWAVASVRRAIVFVSGLADTLAVRLTASWQRAAERSSDAASR